MSIIKHVSDQILVKDFVQVDKLYITAYGQTFDRILVKSKDAVAVLVKNTESNTFYFVQQLRACKYTEQNPTTIEAVAGMLEKGEDIFETARRECLEEVGFRVRDLVYWGVTLSAPGIITEKMHFFYTEVTNQDRIASGGGLDEEHENIKVIELSEDEIWRRLKAAEWDDSKTVLLVQRYFLEKHVGV
ncbi:NUDIX domain-containing protein [bacterium]|nr:NUDIX domain-containing protein [bacterium]